MAPFDGSLRYAAMKNGGLKPPGDRAAHLCIDMQRLFSSEGVWPTPWMDRVLPVVAEIADRHKERTIFTRFITPVNAGDMPGMWRPYYRRWAQTTRQILHPDMLELMPPLKVLTPPATVIDKTRYSAFAGSGLSQHLVERGVDTLVITGSETDVCVLSTVLSAVDLGYRVIVVRDGICSSSDEGHDALLTVYSRRYSLQIEMADAQEILAMW